VVVPKPTQPSIPLGLVNEDQLRPGRQGQAEFIPFVDKSMGASETTLAIPERFCGKVPSQRGPPSFTFNFSTFPEINGLLQIRLHFTSTQRYWVSFSHANISVTK